MASTVAPQASGIDVEQLVQRMYQPGNATEIKQIETHLRDLQRSSQGWEMADHLLGCSDTNVRFFGALTFQVKLNTGSSELDDAGLERVGQRLVHWFIIALQRGDSPMILRKLSATIANFNLLKTEMFAETCVKRIILSIGYNSVVDIASDTPVELSTTVAALNNAQLISLLWFITSLTEEATKQLSSVDTQAFVVATSLLQANCSDSSTLLRHCFSPSRIHDDRQLGHNIQLEAMSTLMAWTFAAQKLGKEKATLIQPLRALMDVALEWFEMAGLDDAADVVAELLSNYPSFFTKEHLMTISGMLVGPWGETHISVILLEPTDELPSFVRMLLAVGEVWLGNFVTQAEETRSTTNQLIGYMHKLLQSPGFAAVEDIIVVEALEFWTAYVEFVIDAEFEDPDEQKPWLVPATAHIMQIFQELWMKIKLPTPEQYIELGTDRQREFRQFRIDVMELLVSAYPALRNQLTRTIVELCLHSLSKPDWLEIEASLFCLNAISIAEQEGEDETLSRLFGSPLYVQLKEANTSIPARTRAAAVDLLGQYAEFFERHTEYLPAALDFLFAALQAANLAPKSAKSIASLSSSCRSSLVEQLPSFVQAYEQFLAWPTSEVSTKERVIGGIAAIVQALPVLEDQAAWLDTLMRFVQQDMEQAAVEFARNRIEEGQVFALNAVRSLASIGKASQAQQDEPLEDEYEAVATEFWRRGTGLAIQNHIFDVIRKALEIFNASPQPLELHGEIIEAICQIFKSGFTETKPGPFVFSAGVFVDYFGTAHLTTPRLELILSTACSFLRSHSHATSPDVINDATRLLQQVIRIISEIQDLREVSDTTGLLEVMERFMPRYTAIFFTLPQQDIETLFNLPLQCLSVPEPLPKRAAAQFWTAFLNLTPSRSKVSQEHLDDVINHFGPRLATVFMQNVAGGATRTDLDWLAEPVKKFSSRTVHTRGFLETALAGINVEPDVGVNQKARFLKQIAVANNRATTKTVITAFWSQCRGFSGNYAP